MRRAVICMLSLAVALFSLGAFRVSKSAEAGLCSCVCRCCFVRRPIRHADLTFNRPSGWEMAIAGAAVRHGFSVAGS